MPATHTLDLLIDLAREAVDDATRTLGVLQTGFQQATGQLRLLEGYLDDYRTRLQESVGDGLQAAAWQNYQRFLVALEGAIAEQRHAVARAQTQLESGRDVWRSCTRRRDAFDALARRRLAERTRVESRREQRASDEFAARRFASAAVRPA